MKTFDKIKDKGHMGEFDDQIELIAPNGKKVYIDNHLVEEIKYLWKYHGIETIASCSGHREYPPTIIVSKKSIPKMVEIGYQVWINPSCNEGFARYDGFYAKFVELTKTMIDNHLKDIKEHLINDEKK